jgi:PAS domain S-box-containing protein
MNATVILKDPSTHLKRLSRAAVAVCGFGICLALFFSFVCVNGLSNLLTSAEIINVAGRQRMLSMRISNLAGMKSNNMQSFSDPQSAEEAAAKIAKSMEEMRAGYVRIQTLIASYPSHATLIHAQDSLAKTEKHRNDLLDAAGRFLAEFDKSEPDKSSAVVSEIHLHSELFLPEMEQATTALQANRRSEVQSLQNSIWMLFGMFAAGFLGFIGLFVLPSIRLAKQEHKKALTQVDRIKQLATIAEKTTNVAIFTDTKSRILWVNNGFTHVTGYSLQEVIGKVPGHFLQCDETCPKTVAAMRSALRNRENFNGLILNQRKDGSKYWLQIDIQPSYDEQGTHIGFVAMETDVTEQKRVQSELEKSTRFLHAAIDSIPAQVAILDEQGTILFVNSNWKRFAEENDYRGSNFGVGHNYLAMCDCDTQQEGVIAADVARGIRSVMNGELKSFEYEYPCDSPTEVRWFLMTVSQFDCHEPIRLVVSHVNITERKIAQQRLEVVNQQLTQDIKSRISAEEKLRSVNTYLDVYRKIVDHHAIVAETDTRGTIVSVNDAFCRISGYSREELVGQNHRILNSGLHPKAFWKEMYKSVANGGFWHAEVCNRSKNGELYWVDTTIAPLFDDVGKVRGYFAIRADITSLKHAQARAELASRSKSEFLANMSHEIRTPMTAILGYADVLAEKGLSATDSIDCIDTIKRNGEHLLSIINDILDISKIEADKMTAEKIKVSPLQVVRDVVDLMRVKSQAKGLLLETRIADGIPETIETDPTRLRQILVNLVGNAIKFTETGCVTIAVRMDSERIDQIVFDIIDTGIGLKKEQIDVLFQAFEQADTSMTRKFGGTGLGLRISKRLAEILGGDITVSCGLGRGCMFSASIATGSLVGIDRVESNSLQASADAGAQKADAKSLPELAEPKVKALRGLRIMLVEDGPDNQRLISFVLRKAGANVEIFENGKLAVERLTLDGTIEGALSQDNEIDLVLMDMQMPVMDGYTATQILREKGCSLPILALTAHALDVDQAKCLEAVCNIRLTKPIDKSALIEACAGVSRIASLL